DDHAREGGESLQQGLIDRVLPEDLGVGEGARNEDEVARTVAEDAVGDVDVAASRVPDLIPHVPAPSLLQKNTAFSKHDQAARELARRERAEGLVGLVETVAARDELIDLELAGQVKG